MKTPKNASGAVNRWAFVAVSKRPAHVAHLWTEALGSGWLRPACGRFPGDYFDDRNLDRATGEFRKCRDCIQHEVQRG